MKKTRHLIPVIMLVLLSLMILQPVSADVGSVITKSYYLYDGQNFKTQIQFHSSGYVDLYVPAGCDFDLYAKEGGDWPTDSNFATIYDKCESGSSLHKHLEVPAGLWYFTIYARDGNGQFTFTAQSGTGGGDTEPCEPLREITETGYLTQGHYDYFSYTVTGYRTKIKWDLYGPDNTRPLGTYAASSTADADFDLYVSLNEYPTTYSYDWADTSFGPDGHVEINYPSTGTYYVMVKADEGSGNFELKTKTYNCDGEECEPLYTSVKTGYLTQGGYDYLSYAVTGYRTKIEWDLEGPDSTRPLGVYTASTTADADYNMYVALNRYPATYSYDWADTTFGPNGHVEIDYPSTGTYYVMIRAKEGSGNYKVTGRSYDCHGGGGCDPSYEYTDEGTLLKGESDKYTFSVKGSKKRLVWTLIGPDNTRPLGTYAASYTADADYNLYVSLDEYPTTYSYDWADTSFGPDGTVEITDPPVGDYKVMVYAKEGSGDYQLISRSYDCY